MPPHLHPRSRMTTSLFTTTLLASFAVVGLPHILPCPAGPRTSFADGEMNVNGQKRRRRKSMSPADENTQSEPSSSDNLDGNMEAVSFQPRGRECPVPKPRGLVGEILGFKSTGKETSLPPVEITSRRVSRSED
ncbi:putative alpha-1,3-mannosyltransferase [Xylona heveae TC161]|uniref:Putative alpha-1,3-mannosyltransferase n=1 Tax=Xylona heveae (strain CBS 132557 / TC161) TaxID=1328760 RepID=A0A165HCU0_XYLHT|nr:putative alpha-1,3-mannosyltransferase [Xylona heveae TC161]KZF23315.1 putative alpha-1,3-mannosyltransferase [Xylona heveae TC161]